MQLQSLLCFVNTSSDQCYLAFKREEAVDVDLFRHLHPFSLCRAERSTASMTFELSKQIITSSNHDMSAPAAGNVRGWMESLFQAPESRQTPSELIPGLNLVPSPNLAAGTTSMEVPEV